MYKTYFYIENPDLGLNLKITFEDNSEYIFTLLHDEGGYYINLTQEVYDKMYINQLPFYYENY